MKTYIFSAILLVIFLFFDRSLAAQEIWGMAQYGGQHGKGVIFKTDENGSNYEVVYSFEDIGVPDEGFTETTEGIFYGFEGDGILRFTTSDRIFNEVFSFDEEGSGGEGVGRMFYASNGLLYGMTASGGINDMGTLIEFDPDTEEVSKLIDFDGTDKGSHPKSSLVQATDGFIYGMTSAGGVFNSGTIFKFNTTTGEFTKLLDFNEETTGSNPHGSLTEASDGSLYGMLPDGGENGFGLIFQFNPVDGQFTKRFEFDDEISGRNPQGSLTRATNGKLYGLTSHGGADGYGTLFEYDSELHVFTKKVDFIPNADIGIQNNGKLLAHPNGKLYGLVQDLGHDSNLLYEYDPVLDSFKRVGSVAGARESTAHERTMTLSSNGRIYFCISGSVDNIIPVRNLNEFDPSENKLTDYFSISGSKTGNLPHGSLTQGNDGMLYGTTSSGGEYEKGVVFKIDPVTFEYEVVLSFNGSNGSTPSAGLVGTNNLLFYGMTPEGGEFGKGVIYKIDPTSGEYTKLVDFDGTNGQYPDGVLIKKMNNTTLYGTTTTGGEHGDGVLFELDPVSDTFTKLTDFDGEGIGKNPYSHSLVAVPNGNIFGTIHSGTAVGKGKLFEFDTQENELNIVVDFDTVSTSFSLSSLALTTDNYLVNLESKFNLEDYTYSGINLNDGPLFGISGRLLQASNGKLYGLSVGYIEQTHSASNGELFEVDLDTESYNVIHDFSWSGGGIPENASLLQLGAFTPIIAQCKNDTIYLNENGQADISPEDLDNGSSGDGIELTISQSEFYCDDLGDHNLTLTVTDENGNNASCNGVITVFDTIPPVVECQSVELYLDAVGKVEIDASQIDNGSFDACGISIMELDVDSFTCQNLGENLVALSVTDTNGNTSSCDATVTIIDNLAPEILCTPDFSRHLDPYERVYVIETDYLTAESTDNCGIDSVVYFIDGERITDSIFSAELELEAGVYTIDLEETDGSKNVSACSTVITIEKRPTSILIVNNDIDKEEGVIQIQAVLLDDLLIQGIEGKPLEFNLNDDTVTALTHANGTVTVALPFDLNLPASYTVTAILEEDDTYLSSTAEIEIITGTETAVLGNVRVYPNPFNEQLHIEFTSPETADARISLFDAAGRLVKTVFNRPVEAGMFYKAEFRAETVTDGYYIYQVEVGSFKYSGIIISFNE